jgi:transposase
VCAVARRHGLSPRQLFGWRRQLRQETESVEPQAPLFVPAVIEATAPEPLPKRVNSRSRQRGGDAAGIIAVEIDGVTVWISRAAVPVARARNRPV